jgi:uncharacterized protein (TIGR02186 family)
MTRLAAASAVGALLWTSPVLAERLILSLSSPSVAIGSDYSGGQVVAFGIVERDGQTVSRRGEYDVVITLRGPREAPIIRRKEEFGPIWLNRSQQKFVSVPAALGVYASRPLRAIADEPTRLRLRLGISAIVAAPDFTLERGGYDEPFRAALVRLKARDGLYEEKQDAVTFITPEVFRASLSVPAIAPPGRYEVEATLLAEGILIARQQAGFELVKTGFEEKITTMARERRLLYGLATAATALFFGWLASVIFRRD